MERSLRVSSRGMSRPSTYSVSFDPSVKPALHGYSRFYFVFGLLSTFSFAAACGANAANPKSAQISRKDTNIAHEACSEGQISAFDANGDSKPDVFQHFSGSTLLCTEADFNYDGRVDMVSSYDASGQIKRREADYDGDAVPNLVEYYEGGKLVRREIDSLGRGKLDTWDFFDTNTALRTSRERDLNGDGYIDQWWYFEPKRTLIAYDRNEDGMPDPEEQLVLDASGRLVDPNAPQLPGSASSFNVPSAPSAPPVSSAQSTLGGAQQ